MTTLFIRTDGRVEGLYTEDIDLPSLGPLAVTRAMTIEFAPKLQVWRVFDPMGDCVYCSPSRQVCLDWERQHLNQVLEQK